MALIEKQGYLGDLHSMSMTELKELLKRQEKLVSNPVIVKRLPDKGCKIFSFIEKIKEAMIQLENIDKTADLFEKMAIQSEKDRQQRLGLGGKQSNEDNIEILQQLAERGNEEKVIVDERTNSDVANTREKILQKADKKPSKYKFRPNRTIRNTDLHGLADTLTSSTLHRDVVSKTTVTSVSDDGHMCKEEKGVKLECKQALPEHAETVKSDTCVDIPEYNISSASGQKCSADLPALKSCAANVSSGESRKHMPMPKAVADISEARGKLRYRYDESLETQMYTGKARCQKAEMIPIQESVQLLENQQKSVQELQAKYAAEKLAERLHIKMDEFKCEGQSNLSYRNQDADSDDDDDDDDNERMDYPE